MSDVEQQEGTEGIDPEILAEATEQGWVPEDQWRGDPKEWSDAETFVRRGREINPILRKALKKERETTAAMRVEMQAMGATVAELREYLAKVEERATANALATLKRQRTAALEAGDHAAAAEVEEQMDALKDSPSAVPKAKPAAAPQKIHPEVQEWMDSNPWYSEENEDMKIYADGVAAKLMKARAGTSFTPADILPTVTERVKKMFPDAFGGRQTSAMFESSGGSGSSGSGRPSNNPSGKSAFDKLPKETQAQFHRFFNAGYYIDLKTRKPLDLKAAQAEYMKEYDR